MLPTLASGEPYRTDDGLLVTAAGQLIAISLVVTPMISDGVVIGAVLVFRDITRQKQVERERQQTEGSCGESKQDYLSWPRAHKSIVATCKMRFKRLRE